MKFINTLSCLAFSIMLYGQTYQISPDLNIKNDFAYYIIPLDNGNIALARDKSFRLVIQILNEKFEWSSEIDVSLKGKKWRLLEMINDHGLIGIFYVSKLENETALLYECFKTNGQLISSKNLLQSHELTLQAGFKLQKSEDSNWFAIGYQNGDTDKKLLLFNKAQDSVYYNLSLKNILPFQESSVSDLLLTNHGDTYFFGLAKNHPTHKRKLWYLISALKKDGKLATTQGFDLGDCEFYDGKIAYNNQTDCFILAGLYSEKSSSLPKGYLHTNWCMASGWKGVKTTPFSDRLLKNWSGNEKKVAFSNSDLHTQYITFDLSGGFQVFFEKSKELSRRPYFSSTLDPGTAAYNRWVDYYYDDIVVACFHSDTLRWDIVLHKKQYSQDDDAVFSSFFLFVNSAFLRLIFNDEIRNEGTASEYILRSDGQFIRKSILNTSYKNLNLRFVDAIALDASTILVPSENAGRLNLVKISL